jgi:hypothetical protein
MNKEPKQTEVREDWLIELEELELEVVVGGVFGNTGPVVADSTSAIGLGGGSAIDDFQSGANKVVDATQSAVGKVGIFLANTERS